MSYNLPPGVTQAMIDAQCDDSDHLRDALVEEAEQLITRLGVHYAWAFMLGDDPNDYLDPEELADPAVVLDKFWQRLSTLKL